jgi:hypothetical protein
MGFVTKAEAYVISELKSTIMDRLHMGGSFLQQSPTVTIGGLPVAIKQGGLGAIGGQLGGIISQVQAAAGAITAITQNPMSALEGAVNSKIGDVSSKISSVAGKLTGGQLSSLTNGITGIQNALTDFQAHTQLLSGQATAILDAVPDFNKIKDAGSNLSQLTGETPSDFIANTASALFSDTKLNNISNSLQYVVANKLDEISRLDSVTDSVRITTLVNDCQLLINNHANTMNAVVDSDTHAFNEASNTLTAASTVVGVASQFTDTSSVGYALFSRIGTTSAKEAFGVAASATET